jgi:hypothetical protein
MTTTAKVPSRAEILASIGGELAKAAAPRPVGNKKPIFLFFKPGHKALIRPLYDLGGAVILSKHDKFDRDRDKKVASICAHAVGEECKICADATSDKKLLPNDRIYLAAYVYKVTDAAGQVVTYTEKDDNDKEIEKPIAGVRILELCRFGAVSQILSWFWGYMNEEDEPAMPERDFTIEQVGEGQTKKFNVTPKSPKPMADHISSKIPAYERIRERILDALPPVLPSATVAIPSLRIVSSDDTEEAPLDVNDEF